MFQRIKQGILLSVIISFAAGCTTIESGSAPTQHFAVNQQNETSQARDLTSGDGIEVSVEVDGIMEVSLHQAKLNHEGVVTLPLVGDIKVGGLKLAEARNVIAKTYRAYYVNPPVVIVTLIGGSAEGEWGYVSVLGRVNKPGRVPLQSQSGIKLSAAIQLADGFATSAKTSDIRISRTDELGMKTRVSVNFKQIGQAGDAEADILLIKDDIVYVPERIF